MKISTVIENHDSKLQKIIDSQRKFQRSGVPLEKDFRLAALKTLKSMVSDNEDKLIRALKDDLSKSESEAFITEISIVYQEIDYALKNLNKWMRPHKVPQTPTNIPSKNYILPEPYGVVAILSPWNYPVNLALVPLVGALAAGNSVILKASRSSLQTSELLRELITKYFPAEVVYVVDPAIDYDELLEPRYDYIFFTGSTEAARDVMAKAAKYLTPVSLELGGQCPCIVDSTANVKLAAKRIMWGKFLNAGQTCISINHVWVQRSVEDDFVKAMLGEILENYRNAVNDPDYPKIISEKHFNRLSGLLDDCLSNKERLVIGGSRSKENQKISPSLIIHADLSDKVMEREIFGPILPILSFDNLSKLKKYMLNIEKPLACYFFSEDIDKESSFMNSVSYGGGCINDVLMHVSHHSLPFGGVGNSGMGAYHGKYSFDTFTHYKPVVSTSTHVDLPFRYPRFAKKNLPLIKKFLKI